MSRLRFRMILVAWVLAFAGCAEEEPEQKTCELAGTTVNIGSTTGGAFSADLGSGHYLTFSNLNLNFNVNASDAIVDVGATDCLEDVPPFPGGTSTVVAYEYGHGYSIKFADGSIARFVARDYFGGTVSISYQYPY